MDRGERLAHCGSLRQRGAGGGGRSDAAGRGGVGARDAWESSRQLCNPFKPGEKNDFLVLGREGAGNGGTSHDDIPLLLVTR
jgi:hypothetical protein